MIPSSAAQAWKPQKLFYNKRNTLFEGIFQVIRTLKTYTPDFFKISKKIYKSKILKKLSVYMLRFILLIARQ